MGLSAASAGCDSGPDPTVYHSVAECAAEHGQTACDSAWQASVGEQAASAPQYVRREACEAQYGYGHCEAYSGASSSVFIPLMAGFVIGRAMQRQDSSNPYGGGGGYFGRAVYYDARGGYRAPVIRSGEAVYTRQAGFTERFGFGRAGGFLHGFRGG